MKSKFKVGDLVMLYKKVDFYAWSTCCDEHIGKIGKIEEISTNDSECGEPLILIQFLHRPLYVRESSLLKIPNEMRETEINY